MINKRRGEDFFPLLINLISGTKYKNYKNNPENLILLTAWLLEFTNTLTHHFPHTLALSLYRGQVCQGQ